MKYKILSLSTLIHLAITSVFAAPSMFMLENKTQHIFVNNRIVANVHGKAISVIDVMKKMDLLFYRKFPEYASSVEARYQFYSVNWRHMLSEIIEKELILADAEENKIPVSNGDIRQEIENLFGPNIIANLDNAGLTFEEAWEMVKEELIMRKMIGFKVNSKAIRSVVPQDIRNAYSEYAKKNKIPAQWKYQVISIRGEDSSDSAETANEILHYVLNENISVANLLEKVQEFAKKNKTTVNISEEYVHTEKEMSPAYKEILASLHNSEFSKPIAQKSKASQAIVFRIFHLKEFVPEGVISYNEMEQKIKNKLVDQAVEKEAQKYLEKLKVHFNLSDKDQELLVPEDFEPFVLKKVG